MGRSQGSGLSSEGYRLVKAAEILCQWMTNDAKDMQSHIPGRLARCHSRNFHRPILE